MKKTRNTNHNKKFIFKVALTILILFLLIFSYSTFVYSTSCKTEECFISHLKNCDRASYSKFGDFSMRYKITGQTFRNCEVKVELTNISQDFELRPIYQDSIMFCNLKIGTGTYPESTLGSCSGMLKEGFQELLIDRLKVEILKNIEDINLNVLKG